MSGTGWDLDRAATIPNTINSTSPDHKKKQQTLNILTLCFQGPYYWVLKGSGPNYKVLGSMGINHHHDDSMSSPQTHLDLSDRKGQPVSMYGRYSNKAPGHKARKLPPPQDPPSPEAPKPETTFETPRPQSSLNPKSLRPQTPSLQHTILTKKS